MKAIHRLRAQEAKKARQAAIDAARNRKQVGR